MKRVSLLGSTGSIGTSTIDVLNAYPDRFELISLAAGRNTDLLLKQAQKLRPKRVYTAENIEYVTNQLKPLGIDVVHGDKGLEELAADTDVDLVINGLAAGVGLRPTLAAVQKGTDVAIANKETLVVAGHLITEWAQKTGSALLPLDSETTPLWQSLQDTDRNDVKRILLPASGGPFFDWTKEQMASITRHQALNHPTWQMGPKITIDSATLMNKGFEVIEAQWFLDLPVSKVDVIIHRQSIVHCLIEYVDLGLMAHLSTPDMRLPIHQALVHPEKLPTQIEPLDLTKVGTLSFFEPDTDRFPCLQLAYDTVTMGGTAPTALNAANEIAVYAFLEGRIGFLDIPTIIRQTLEDHKTTPATEIESIFAADHWAREHAQRLVQKHQQ
ncbi:MAG: 1-deoxy-D-xylulose-5-phosphate reductoisomerase [Candidatus Latescibacteria bacterium]|nr:1-deoxy-D-xylulose-5-phosphate reductoisomerase [Candidatus Latescibacterota bacterium]